MRLRGKVAIVTGAGTGIGKATAKLFADEGARVVLVGRRQKLLESVAADIAAAGGTATTVAADISEPAQVRSMVQEAIAHFDRIDVLFNNAGIASSPHSIVDLPLADWDAVLNVNLTGAFLCCRHVVPVMIANGGGSIVNCGSISAHIGQPKQGAYNASKGGIEQLTKCVALDFAEFNIRCNSVSPAWVETDLNKKTITALKKNPDAYKRALSLHPLGRFGRPIDVAHAVLFLSSDEASWITGTSLIVDGGYTCQ